MQISVLRQGILLCHDQSQTLRHFRESPCLVMAHTECIQCLASRSRHRLHIFFQQGHCRMIVTHPITRLTLDALHFHLILVTGKMTQIICRHRIGFRISFTKQMNLAYIIRYERVIHIVTFQRDESFQRLFITAFHIVDVCQMIHCIRLVSLSDIPQQTEPHGRLLQVAGSQISRCQLKHSLIAFLVRQGIQFARAIQSNGLQIHSLVKIGRSDHRLHPVGMSRVRIFFQISFQQIDAVFRLQFIFPAHSGILFVACSILRQHLLCHTRQSHTHQGSYPNSSFLHC